MTEASLPDLSAVLGRSVTVLGSTGSVGVSTLEVIRHARARYGADAFPLQALTAQRNVARLAEQAKEFLPRAAVIADASLAPALQDALAGTGIEIMAGLEAVREVAARPSDIVMAAIVGAAGLAPTLAAIEQGGIVALANKECVVAAGEVLARALVRSRAALIPVDSEHNAAFQLLEFGDAGGIEKVTLTASGGPFLSWPLERMAKAAPEEAVHHPNWRMGHKISVDCATMMNKGLELIEAHILFRLPAEKLDVVVHPQSIVHCLVSYADGSVLAQMAAPDMRTPIAHALAWPRRMESPSRKLNLASAPALTFEHPDSTRFPCLTLAKACLRAGGPAPTILNAANEVAVEHFLNRRIGFLGIAETVERTLDAFAGEMTGEMPATLAEVLALDDAARIYARDACAAAAA